MTRKQKHGVLATLAILVTLFGALAFFERGRVERSPAVGAAPPMPLEMAFSGCAAVTAGPVCELTETPEERTVLLLAKVEKPSDVTFETDRGRSDIVKQDTFEDEIRWRVRIPIGATELRARRASRSQTVAWRLVLAPSKVPDWMSRARRLRAEGKIDEALALVSPHASDGGAAGAWANGLVARVAFRRGDAERATRLLEMTAEAHFVQGRLSDGATDLQARAFMLCDQRYAFVEARHSLARVRIAAAGDPSTDATTSYYEGVAAERAGDMRSALARYKHALSASERLENADFVRNASGALPGVLETLGRFEEVYALSKKASDDLPIDTTPGERARELANRGVDAIRLAETVDTASARFAELTTDAEASLRQALALLPSETYPAETANVETELSRLRVCQGNLVEARTHLARAKQIGPRPSADLQVEETRLAADIAFREGRFAESAAAYRALDDIALGLGSDDLHWKALTGLGKAFVAMSRIDAALEAFSRAESYLDIASTFAPLGTSHGAFLASRDESARWRVELLLRLGRVDEARAAAAASHRRALRVLAVRGVVEALPDSARLAFEQALETFRSERAKLDDEAAKDWELPGPALLSARRRRGERDKELRASLEATLASAAPRLEQARVMRDGLKEPRVGFAQEGEVLLAFHPLPTGWVGFVTEGRHTDARRLKNVEGNASPSAIARELLEPFRDELVKARSVRVSTMAGLENVDLHALPLDGAPLYERAAVSYPVESAGASSAKSFGPIVVVADPSGNLPLAREEAVAILDLARAAHRDDVRMLTQSAATGSAVVRELAGASLFHFAGHGSFATGNDWESLLTLAGSDRLSVSDVFALPSAPARVVLSACEGARASADGLGVAQAFVAVGARLAIGATRKVDDEVARAMSVALFSELMADPDVDGGVALQRAQRALHAAHPAWDVAAYRAIVRSEPPR